MAKKKAKKAAADVRIDPNLPLILGNTVTFVAPEGEGLVKAKLVASNGTYWVKATNGSGDARISWIVQGTDEVTVEFHDDGKKYAEGTFSI